MVSKTRDEVEMAPHPNQALRSSHRWLVALLALRTQDSLAAVPDVLRRALDYLRAHPPAPAEGFVMECIMKGLFEGEPGRFTEDVLEAIAALKGLEPPASIPNPPTVHARGIRSHRRRRRRPPGRDGLGGV